MAALLDDAALDTLFRTARTYYTWSPEPVTDTELHELYELLKWGPTSANASPARFLFCRTADAKAKLAACASDSNKAKVLAAPVTVVVAEDEAFYDRLPELFPHADARAWFAGPDKAAVARATAFRNASLQGAYLIMAARALGLDCGPMSGFDAAAVDAAFFEGTTWRANFLCSVGHGTTEGLFPRLPRLAFEDACRLA